MIFSDSFLICTIPRLHSKNQSMNTDIVWNFFTLLMQNLSLEKYSCIFHDFSKLEMAQIVEIFPCEERGHIYF